MVFSSVLLLVLGSAGSWWVKQVVTTQGNTRIYPLDGFIPLLCLCKFLQAHRVLSLFSSLQRKYGYTRCLTRIIKLSSINALFFSLFLASSLFSSFPFHLPLLALFAAAFSISLAISRSLCIVRVCVRAGDARLCERGYLWGWAPPWAGG